MPARGVQNAQIFRFFKKAYFSTGAYPIPIFSDKKIENRINFWRARPNFLVPGGLGHPQVPGESLFGRNSKFMWKPYTGSIFYFMAKNFLLVIFRTSFSKNWPIFATFSKNLILSKLIKGTDKICSKYANGTYFKLVLPISFIALVKIRIFEKSGKNGQFLQNEVLKITNENILSIKSIMLPV